MNLADCCRSMVMLMPELETIIEAKLISSGYKRYEHLTAKLTCFLTYLNPMVIDLELFTLPIVKSILNYATISPPGHDSSSENLSSVSVSSVEETVTQIEEERLLIEAIVSALTPMLSTQHRGLMKQVLQEVFPLSVSHVYTINVPPRVRAMVLEQFESNKCEVVPVMLEKTLELYHVIQNRKCVLLVGPTTSGKTTMLQILTNAINFMQATEAVRLSKDIRVFRSNTSVAPVRLQISTPFPAEESRDNSVAASLPQSKRISMRSDAERLMTGLNAALTKATRSRPLDILRRPEKRADSELSGPCMDAASNEKIRTYRLFVNTHTIGDFLGSGCSGSDDGVFIDLCKKLSSPTAAEASIQNWVILDGDLEVYMESMLSTAISNKVISSLDSSQIRIRDNVQFFVETDGLSKLSPSFITKCGVVIMSSTIIGWRQRFRSWLKKAEKEFSLTKCRVFTLNVLMETFIGHIIQFLDLNAQYLIRTDGNHAQSVSALLRWLNVFFTKYVEHDRSWSEDELTKLTVLIFIHAYVWSFGANITDACIASFDECVKQQITECNHDVIYPDTGTVFDWCIHPQQLKFILWRDYFSDIKSQLSLTFTSTIVHETTLHLTEMLQSAGVPVVLVGPSASGKSSFIQNCALPKLHPIKIQVSHLSTMRELENKIESKLIQHQRRQQVKTGSSNLSLLIEDCNIIPMTGPRYGLQEVLRKVMAGGETYSFKRKVFRHLGAAHFILTCNSLDSLGSGSGTAVSGMLQRLSNYFNFLPFHAPNELQWRGIFLPVVLSWLDDFPAYNIGPKSLLAFSLVGATCRVYQIVQEILKPLPGSTHYIFDAHSLSQTFQGFFLLSPSSKFRQMRMKGGQAGDRHRAGAGKPQRVVDLESLRNMVHLWFHEVQRVFSDRVPEEEGRSLLYRHVMETIQEFFCEKWPSWNTLTASFTSNLSINMTHLLGEIVKADFEQYEGNLLEFEDLQLNLPINTASDLVFTRQLAGPDAYTEESLPLIEEHLDDIMKEMCPEEMLSFSRAAKHAARLSRSLLLGGHSVMLGPKGSGRKVIAQVTALAHDYTFYHIPSPSKDASLKTDLISALIEAGSGTKPILLFIEDGWTVEDYADLAFFLMEGHHPTLIDPEMLNFTNVNMDVFYKRIQQQLHLVLSLDTDGVYIPPSLSLLLTTYPVFLKKCTSIDFHSLWSSSTLSEIAFTFLEKQEKRKNPEYNTTRYSPESKSMHKMLANLASSIHLTALHAGEEEHGVAQIHNFVNPSSFIDLLHLYTVMESRIKTEIKAKLSILTLVFEKIRQVQSILDTKRDKLESLKPLLKTAQVIYHGWCEELKSGRAKYQSCAALFQSEDEAIQNQENDISELQNLHDLDLEAVSPVLEQALYSLESITKGDFCEIRSFHNPPEPVKFALGALVVLLGTPPSWDPDSVDAVPTWEQASALLRDSTSLSRLSSAPFQPIKKAILNRLKRDYLDDPRFSAESLRAVSASVACIHSYIAGIYQYSTTVRKLKPKKERMAQMNQELGNARAALGRRHVHLEELQGELDEKVAHQDASYSQIRDIQGQIKTLKRAVRAAEGLLECLEKKRAQWATEKDNLSEQLKRADGDAMLAAGAITYYGPFSANARGSLMRKWKDPPSPGQSFITEGLIPRSPMFDILSLLGPAPSSGQAAQDTHSLESILIVRELLRNSKRQILIADPDDQLKEWSHHLTVGEDGRGGSSTVRLSDCTSDFGHASIASGDLGASTILVGEESSEYIVYQTLKEMEEGSISRNNLTIVTGVCDEGSDLPNMSEIKDRCILSSGLPVEKLTDRSLSQTVVVNFALSGEGITSSLSKIILHKQAPYLSSKTTAYHRSKENRLMTMEIAERKLLDFIANYRGGLLDSTELPLLIEKTEEMVTTEEQAVSEINSRLMALAEKTDKLAPLSSHGLLIVQVLRELNGLSFHYDFKLSDVREALCDVLGQKRSGSGLSISTTAKVEGLKKELQEGVYRKLQMRMSSSDIGYFPILLVVRLLLRSGRMTSEEYQMFVNHEVHQFPYHPDQVPNWIARSAWQSLDLLEHLPIFSGLKEHIHSNQALYQEYFTLAPVLLEPSPWDEMHALTIGQRALLWAFCRPAEMHKVLQDIIMYEVGSDMVFLSAPVNATDTPSKMVPRESPALLILGKGVSEIVMSVKKWGGEVRVVSLLSDSLQEEAVHMVTQGTRYGYTVVLTHCHLITHWSATLLSLLDEVVTILKNRQAALPDRIHDDFTLVLVSSLYDQLALPEILLKRLTVRIYRDDEGLANRLEESTRMCLGERFNPSCETFLTATSQLHAFLVQKESRVIWDLSDLVTTNELISRLSGTIDGLTDAVIPLVLEVTYGIKCVVDSDRSLLQSGVDLFLSRVSPIAPVLPEIPRDGLCLKRLGRSDQTLDVAFVTNYILSALPSAPRIMGPRGHTVLSLFFTNEAQYYTDLLSRVTNDLLKLQEGFAGVRIIHHGDKLWQCLSHNAVPPSWQETKHGLGNWVSDLSDKVWRLNKMVGCETQSEMSGRNSSTTTEQVDHRMIYSLSTFYRPKHFLLSFLYDWAASNEVSLSNVKFSVRVLSLASPALGETGLHVEGLELVKAGWDSMQGLMYPALPSSPPFPLPIVLVMPHNSDQIAPEREEQWTGSRIDCPVYTQDGELVTNFVLPSSHSPAQWGSTKPSLRVI